MVFTWFQMKISKTKGVLFFPSQSRFMCPLKVHIILWYMLWPMSARVRVKVNPDTFPNPSPSPSPHPHQNPNPNPNNPNRNPNPVTVTLRRSLTTSHAGNLCANHRNMIT